jgi:hypothetical protein
MRIIRTLFSLVLLMTLVVGCETTQPEQVEFQEVTLAFRAPGVPKLDVGEGLGTWVTWFMFEDADGDESTDDPVNDQFYLWCEAPGDRPEEYAPASVPWTYTLQVSVIRAGQTGPEVITSTNALQGGESVNLTAYDTQSKGSPFIRHKDPIRWNEGQPDERLFRFVDDANLRRQLSQANREVAGAIPNPLSLLDPVIYGLGAGLCNVVFPPEAGPEIVDGNESSLRFTVGKGDTVIVEARRGIDGPSYLNTNGSEPVLNATVALDGRPLQNVTGTQFSTAEPGAPLKFSFTPR